MHEMTIGEVLLACEDAMELYALTNPWGDGKSASTSRETGDNTVSANELQNRGLAFVRETDDLTELPPYVQDLIRETVIGKEATQ